MASPGAQLDALLVLASEAESSMDDGQYRLAFDLFEKAIAGVHQLLPLFNDPRSTSFLTKQIDSFKDLKKMALDQMEVNVEDMMKKEADLKARLEKLTHAPSLEARLLQLQGSHPVASIESLEKRFNEIRPMKRQPDPKTELYDKIMKEAEINSKGGTINKEDEARAAFLGAGNDNDDEVDQIIQQTKDYISAGIESDISSDESDTSDDLSYSSSLSSSCSKKTRKKKVATRPIYLRFFFLLEGKVTQKEG